MKTYSKQELKDVLDKHGKWLRHEDGGDRAYLSHADLRYANLNSASLHAAKLNYADLTGTEGFRLRPIQIVNTKHFITIFDDHVDWGCQ
jgi:uncharacterized protein YjbI with pentapeptide repeats